MNAREVAAVLEEIGVLLDLKGENPFKSRAYAAAARSLEALEADLESLLREGHLQKLPGIGRGLAGTIATLAATGNLPYLEELRQSVPEGLVDLLEVPGLGPKRIRIMHEKLGVDSPGALRCACKQGEVAKLSGFGARTEEKILQGLAQMGKHAGNYLSSEALALAGALCERVRALRGVCEVEIAGSLRRGKEVVKDIDLVAAARVAPGVIRAFTEFPEVVRVVGSGITRASVVTGSGIAVDLRVVKPAAFPFALMYFTGSAEHNTALRRRASAQGLKLNEYGLFKGRRPTRCADEAAVYRGLDLPFILPELRENLGELEAAESGSLPELIASEDVRGLLHMHTRWSDGEDTVEEMARTAASIGLSYIGIADHSPAARYANGLDANRLKKQAREISAVNRAQKKCRVLHGIEADILVDGRVDVPAGVDLDFVVASIHSGFQMGEKEMTARLVRALSDPRVSILGHPTGRLLLRREAYAVNIEHVLAAAAGHGVAVEINANPHRLDLDWRYLRRARELGVRFVISPDAHRALDLAHYSGGVAVARKGWLTKGDVLNTQSAARLLSSLRRPL